MKQDLCAGIFMANKMKLSKTRTEQPSIRRHQQTTIGLNTGLKYTSSRETNQTN